MHACEQSNSEADFWHGDERGSAEYANMPEVCAERVGFALELGEELYSERTEGCVTSQASAFS
ncbi:MAG: hypothetical protein WCD63_01860 [Terrimicrobiaceae bacterium]